ncbi:DUF6783 domain-containing protein [Blautia faecis]|uniref:DUF6783 domain-containing protein n=1 Tax=Blautia faecis TaxID=871665 RepID=UPI003A7F2B65
MKCQQIRECLEKAFCKMCIIIYGRFRPNSVVVASCDNRIQTKYTAKFGTQIARMIFKYMSQFTGTLT